MIPTNKAMLDWCGTYVTQINALVCKRGAKIEVVVQNDNCTGVVTRNGKDMPAAFRAALVAAMEQRPSWK